MSYCALQYVFPLYFCLRYFYRFRFAVHFLPSSVLHAHYFHVRANLYFVCMELKYTMPTKQKIVVNCIVKCERSVIGAGWKICVWNYPQNITNKKKEKCVSRTATLRPDLFFSPTLQYSCEIHKYVLYYVWENVLCSVRARLRYTYPINWYVWAFVYIYIHSFCILARANRFTENLL